MQLGFYCCIVVSDLKIKERFYLDSSAADSDGEAKEKFDAVAKCLERKQFGDF